MQELGRRYPNAGYGGRFIQWLGLEHPKPCKNLRFMQRFSSTRPKPYGSFGNGSVMRVSPCAYAAATLDETLRFAEIAAAVTHNHPEGMRGAKAVAGAIFFALHSADKEQIKKFLKKTTIDWTLLWIRSAQSTRLTYPAKVQSLKRSRRFWNQQALRMQYVVRYQSEVTAIPLPPSQAAYRKHIMVSLLVSERKHSHIWMRFKSTF